MNKIATFFRESMIARFLIPLGIILIIVSVFAFISVNNSKDYIKVDAVVSKIELYEEEHYVNEERFDATYTVYVKYMVDGKNYEEEYGVFSNYKEGDKVTISYNPKDPSDIVQQNTIILPIIFLVGGIASLAGATISIINAINKQKRLNEQEKEWKNGR